MQLSVNKFFALAIRKAGLVHVCHGEMICYRQLIKFGLVTLLFILADVDFNGLLLVDVGTLFVFGFKADAALRNW